VTYGRSGLEPVSSDGGIVTMAWAKLFSSHSNYTQIIHKTRAPDSTKHAINASDNSVFLMARWRDQVAFRETGDQFIDFQWHHICNVDSNDRYAWLIDGVVIQEAERFSASPVAWEDYPWLSGFDPNMAGSASATNVAFTGIRIFSGTLSDAEVVSWKNTSIVPVGRSGEPKVWDGSSWDKHPAKVWDGSSWNDKTMLGYDGADWIAAN